MNTKNYNKLYEKIEEIKDKLKECEKIISDYSEKGDITQELKIKETRKLTELWLEILTEYY